MTRILELGMGWFPDEPGGLNRMYAGLLDSLPGAGATVQGLVAGQPRGSEPVPAQLSFFERREAPTMRRLRACRRAVAESLAVGPVDVIAAHFALYALPVLDLLRPRPLVFHFHGPWADESRAEGQGTLATVLKRRVEACVYRRADRFITLSAAFAQDLHDRFGVPQERIAIVPGGVDACRFALDLTRRAARERLHLPLDRPLVVSVRRLVHRVGLEGLIEAMARVRELVPDALLLIAGRGALAQELAARIAARGLGEHVRLLGFVSDEDLPLLYRACDVSIVPSVALEGFGLTTLESLAAGTPVLVSPVGGLPETVRGLDPGLVMPGGSAADLAHALAGALGAPGRLPSAQACVAYVREQFDWPVIARKTLAVYRSAVTA
jgi:glycosyltransferase involved in cell wall biosynthesis